MANRKFEQFQYSLEKRCVKLFAQVAIGAAGAPTLSVAKSKGISSVARVSAGKYNIFLQDGYQYLLDCKHSIVGPASGIFKMEVLSDSSGSSTPSLQVQFYNAAEAATDPANGSTILMRFELKNSTV